MAKERILLGVHCGAACDGVDAAIVAIAGRGEKMKARELAHLTRPLPHPLAKNLRALLGQAASTSAPDHLAEVDRDLGMEMAAAAEELLKQTKVDTAGLVGGGVSGLCWSALSADVSGAEVGAVMEIGNPAILARRLGKPVAADFTRSAMAGSPVVFLPATWTHLLLFRHTRLSRVLVQLGGAARLTFIPADAAAGDCIAFDAAPCGIILDALSQTLVDRPMDADGALASRGAVHAAFLHELMASPFFAQGQRHNTSGVERLLHLPDWGDLYIQRLILIARKHRCESPQDILATATEMIARAIVGCIATLTERPHEVILAGGGAMNIHLSTRIRALQSPSSTVSCEKFGYAARSLGAVSAAILAAARLDEFPLPCPTATGSSSPAVIGAVFL